MNPSPGSAAHPPTAIEAAAPPQAGPLDDRGNPISLLSISDLKRAEQDPNRRKAELARRLHEIVTAEARNLTPTRLLIGIGAVVAVIGVRILIGWLWPAVSTRNFPMFWPVIIAIIVVSRWMARRTHAPEIARSAVAEGICGSCGYSLEDLPPEHDGCIRCPECGAAWFAVRITQAHWSHAGPAALYIPSWQKRLVLAVPSPRQHVAPDDRGRYVRILDAKLRFLPPARKQQWGSQRVLELRRALRRIGRIPRLLTAALPGAAALILIAIGAFSLLTGKQQSFVMAMVTLSVAAFFAIFAIGFIITNSYAGPRKLLPALRARALCACCGREVHDATPDVTGCNTCPECGAGWRTSGGATPSP